MSVSSLSKKATLSSSKKILRFLKGSVHQGLWFKKGSLHLNAFFDVDWVGCIYDGRSTSDFCVYLGSNPNSWSAKKQPTIALHIS